jgi:alpha-beta hydrolase superfamily lysophospholipase
MLWCDRGGRGEDAYLLLHGLGATGAVWRNGCRALDDRGEWLVVDLPGHGSSGALLQYSVGALASAVAAVLDRDRTYRVIGHSLGVYVGLALASGWFGVRVASVLGIGPKVEWSEADVIALLAHLRADPAVALVAPRIGGTGGTTAREQYEAVRSPLDLGPAPARVAAGTRVSYVPAAAPVSPVDAAGAALDPVASRSATCPPIIP